MWLYFWAICYNLLWGMSASIPKLCCFGCCSGLQSFLFGPFGFLCWKVSTQGSSDKKWWALAAGLRVKSLGDCGTCPSMLFQNFLCSGIAACFQFLSLSFLFCSPPPPPRPIVPLSSFAVRIMFASWMILKCFILLNFLRHFTIIAVSGLFEFLGFGLVW